MFRGVPIGVVEETKLPLKKMPPIDPEKTDGAKALFDFGAPELIYRRCENLSANQALDSQGTFSMIGARSEASLL